MVTREQEAANLKQRVLREEQESLISGRQPLRSPGELLMKSKKKG